MSGINSSSKHLAGIFRLLNMNGKPMMVPWWKSNYERAADDTETETETETETDGGNDTETEDSNSSTVVVGRKTN